MTPDNKDKPRLTLSTVSAATGSASRSVRDGSRILIENKPTASTLAAIAPDSSVLNSSSYVQMVQKRKNNDSILDMDTKTKKIKREVDCSNKISDGNNDENENNDDGGDDDNDSYESFTTIYDLIAVPCGLLFSEIPIGLTSTSTSSSSFTIKTSPSHGGDYTTNNVVHVDGASETKHYYSTSSSIYGNNNNNNDWSNSQNSLLITQPSPSWFPNATNSMASTTSTYVPNSSNEYNSNRSVNKTGGRSTKPLLSRSEAQCMIEINIIAQKIDSLTSVATKALQQQMEYRHWMMSIMSMPASSSLSSSLRQKLLLPLYILIQNQIRTPPQQHPAFVSYINASHSASRSSSNTSTSNRTIVMKQIFDETESVMIRLQILVQKLRQYSDQNWNLASSLESTLISTHNINNDYMGYYNEVNHHLYSNRNNNVIIDNNNNPAQLLAQAKYQLSAIQDEVCRRIERYVLLIPSPSSHEGDDDDYNEPIVTGVNDIGQDEISMEEYCKKIMPGVVLDMTDDDNVHKNNNSKIKNETAYIDPSINIKKDSTSTIHSQEDDTNSNRNTIIRKIKVEDEDEQQGLASPLQPVHLNSRISSTNNCNDKTPLSPGAIVNLQSQSQQEKQLLLQDRHYDQNYRGMNVESRARDRSVQQHEKQQSLRDMRSSSPILSSSFGIGVSPNRIDVSSTLLTLSTSIVPPQESNKSTQQDQDQELSKQLLQQQLQSSMSPRYYHHELYKIVDPSAAAVGQVPAYHYINTPAGIATTTTNNNTISNIFKNRDDEGTQYSIAQQMQKEQQIAADERPEPDATGDRQGARAGGQGEEGESQLSTSSTLCRITASQVDAVLVLNTLSSV